MQMKCVFFHHTMCGHAVGPRCAGFSVQLGRGGGAGCHQTTHQRTLCHRQVNNSPDQGYCTGGGKQPSLPLPPPLPAAAAAARG